MPPDLANNWRIGGWLLRSHHAPSQTTTTNKVDEFKHEFELLESENAEMTSEIDRLRNENALLKREKLNLLNETNQLRMEVEGLESDNSRMSSEVKSLRTEFDEFTVKKNRACEERDRALSEKIALHADIDTKGGRIRELQKEILQYKKSLASATRIDGQLSDMRIQDAMNGLFFAVRDWALKVARQEQTILDLINQETVQLLNGRILRYRFGSSMSNAYALISLFSETLCLSMNQGWIFGASRKSCAQSSVDIANLLHAHIEVVPSVTTERKKQWVLLTNEIVSKDEEAVRRSHKTYVTALVQHVRSKLGDHLSASTVGQKLQAAIQPHVNIIQALNCQEAKYYMEMVTVMHDSKRYKFVPKYMEDANGEEEEGLLQASFFPMLLKKPENGDQKETVVCKVKVIVES